MGDTGVVTGIKDESLLTPGNFELYDPYPNPFNPVTVISWQLAVSSNITLKIYDLLGREIATLLNDEQRAGEYKIEFDAGKYDLVSGIYFIELSSINNNKQQKQRKKIVIVK